MYIYERALREREYISITISLKVRTNESFLQTYTGGATTSFQYLRIFLSMPTKSKTALDRKH